MRAVHVLVLPALLAALAVPAEESALSPQPADADPALSRAALAPLQGQGAGASPARPLQRAARPSETTLSVQAAAFDWREFDDQGVRLLKESGPLFGLNLGYKQYGRRLGSSFGVGVFGGRVNYDGQTQSGIPATTRVIYTGLEGQGNLLARCEPVRHLALEPFIGLGGRLWDRSIQDQGELEGYTERWMSFHGRAGLGVTYDFDRDWRAFAQAGFRLPLYTVQNVDLSKFGDGSINLHPRQQPSPFVETGGRWKLLFVSVFYETLRFDKSDVEQDVIYQPESRSDSYGLRVGLSGAL